MLYDHLAQDLYTEICHIPIIDPHSHINPHQPTARGLEDILGYHYYTELAHSVGMEKEAVNLDIDPADRVRETLYYMSQFDNTAQYQWFLEIARVFLDYQREQLSLADSTWLFERAQRVMNRPGWEDEVLRRSNIETVFLTNDFDDPLQGFDTERYVPCLRTDDLVFHLDDPKVRQRLAQATSVEVGDAAGLRLAVTALFEHFTRHGARACAISLPPRFRPAPVSDNDLARALHAPAAGKGRKERRAAAALARTRAHGVFWMLAEHCHEFKLPFDLMIGVNRKVYPGGVFQGQDLFDHRVSLIQYARLFNAFPQVSFCVSVLASTLNQELVSYSWIFPNVYTSGHWWYSNIPAYIEQDARARLQAVPRTKQIGYYSDMYKLEFGLPKYNMYRRILAQVLAEDFVRPRIYTELQAVSLARALLRDNVRRIFDV